MQKTDAGLMANQLNALAEVFDKKPVSGKALEVWFDALREFPTERVMDCLNTWAKSHGRFPTPAEVWKAVNDWHIDGREAKAAEEVRQNRQPIPMWAGRTEAGSAAAKRIVALVAGKSGCAEWDRDRWIQHWQGLVNSEHYIVSKMAKEALRKFDKPMVEREPGMDDEEIAA